VSHLYRGLLLLILVLGTKLHAQNPEDDDKFIYKPYGSTQDENPFQLKDPPIVTQTIEYDPDTDTYIITELVGGKQLRPPMVMTFDEYMKYTMEQDVKDYWKTRSNTGSILTDKNVKPPFDPSFNPKKEGGLFRGLTVDIRPQGNVEVTLGGNVQKYDNPNLPQRARTQGGLDFDMNINMNVTGQIGDALQLTLKYNNQTGFAFDNQFKLQYAGQEDDIIQLIEAGNVSFPLQTQLITGVQSLRGIKTQMQFGRMTMTSIVAEQQSQKQSIIIEDGAQMQTFELKADQYEADKHFFLAQFFEQTYDNTLRRLPNILSLAFIEEVEVWVTNRTGQTQNVRDVVAFMDMGENQPFSNQITPLGTVNVPDNRANNLYSRLTSSPNTRLSNAVNSSLQGPEFGLLPIQDFEKTFARLLSPSEYTLNPELGYISLNTALQPNQVLGVAFKYNYNGQTYQVGELSRNVPPDSSAAGTKTLFVKMLRSSSIRPDVPTWDLMMKNIYSLGAFQISPEDFRLDIFYIDPGGGQKRFLPSSNLKDDQLIRVLNLDNLNNQGDPQPDGIFDFIPNVTIQTQNGRLIFPVTKPFGEHLEKKLVDSGSGNFVDRYVFHELYDSTIFVAQQFPEKNRYMIKGRYKSSGGGNRIMLGAFQLPEGSVTVSLGGQLLQEGMHYTVDYNMGAVTIIDEGVLNSGQQIKIDFENNALFGFQQRSLMGTRFDYRVSDNLFLGGTIMKMRERPFSQKVNLGQDPIDNTIMGLDMRYNTDLPFLTKVLDKLPFYSTKEMSQLSFSGEVAHLRPGHNRFVGKGDDATVYLDDFEGSSSGYDLKGAPQTWKLASTPRGAKDKNGNTLFPEADLVSDLRYNYNRAKMSWYQIDPSFFQRNQSPSEVFDDLEMRTNHYVRQIFNDELFPNREFAIIQQVFTFDMTYYPDERGPYNFERRNSGEPPFTRGVRPDGKLVAPDTRWGGIMRGIENNNFEVANIEYLEFWMMDPFIYNDNSKGGQLYFNLGSISEDILKDSRMQYEHGLSDDLSLMDSTVWGLVPKAQPIINAFDNNEALRVVQDVGFDGLNDESERVHYAPFLNEVQVNPDVLAQLQADPSSDNFSHYLDAKYSGLADIISRYKDWNNPHGNSPVLSGGNTLSGSNTPDQEDLNRDNSLNENEEYFQYVVDLYPGMDIDNHPYIISRNIVPAREYEGFLQPAFSWYQFRIPVRDYDSRVGNIQDFRSIQYMRMFMTGWEDEVTLRFGTLELIRNQWRTFQLDLSDPNDNLPIDEDGTFFNITQVNIEENSGKEPVNYVVPPGILREQGIAQNANQLVAQNEQAMAANVCGLKDGDSRAVFKPVNLDLRNYKRIIMDLHANRFPGQEIVQDGELTAFIRLGIDFRDNYYQYEVPLEITPDGFYNGDSDVDREIVWPPTNKIDLKMEDLVEAKKQRTEIGWPTNVPYTFVTDEGRIVTIKGIPDLGSIQVLMLGVRNPPQNDPYNPLGDADDGRSKCAEVWFNELRIAGFDETAGSAALANVSIKLADLGNINFSTNIHSIGFGQVDMQVDQRFRNKMVQYDFNTNLELGKFLPQKANIRLPFFASISQGFTTPQYDPYQLDIESKDQIEAMKVFSEDSAAAYKRQIQSITTRKGFNFTNVRKLPGENQKRLFFFSPENLAFTYSYTLQDFSDPFIETDYRKNYLGRIDYIHALQPNIFIRLKKP
jgi:cell surface protein SprA